MSEENQWVLCACLFLQSSGHNVSPKSFGSSSEPVPIQHLTGSQVYSFQVKPPVHTQLRLFPEPVIEQPGKALHEASVHAAAGLQLQRISTRSPSCGHSLPESGSVGSHGHSRASILATMQRIAKVLYILKVICGLIWPPFKLNFFPNLAAKWRWLGLTFIIIPHQRLILRLVNLINYHTFFMSSSIHHQNKG